MHAFVPLDRQVRNFSCS